MGLPKPYWADMATTDFAGTDVASWIAVLPIAAVEQHGPHLPMSTDATIARGMIEATIPRLDGLPVTVLPLLALGKSNEHVLSPGTLTLGWETMTRTLIEVGESVARAGVKKLVIVNAHGGNVEAMNIAIRELREHEGMLAVATNWARFGRPDGLLGPQEGLYGIHGGEEETSLMLHLDPDNVDMSRAKDFRSVQLDYLDRFTHLRAHGPAQFGWLSQDLNPEGAMGNAAAATADKGRAILGHQISGFIALLRDVHAFDVKGLAGEA